MKQLKLFTIGLIACLTVGTAVAADTEIQLQSKNATETSQTGPDRIVSPHDNFDVTNGLDPRDFHKINISCGLPPLPPLGCQVGACVCDQYGENCHWTFICN